MVLNTQPVTLLLHARGLFAMLLEERALAGSCSSSEHLPRGNTGLHQRAFNPPVTDAVQSSGTECNKAAE